ncbi:unnamed protein product [Bursaphelenchus okinawaensis]|uniref:Uncharacterized protein n=1 Tax=Bursaphelenchus okinawaensis TaxID=465554 RepID=A0A811K6P2_9BILA|nr:unnamed protein product [Bursaphelenchus okinawaensis]CAG9092625.1 unnamed protein product [Bursaphelenchus okinawaensis]
MGLIKKYGVVIGTTQENGSEKSAVYCKDAKKLLVMELEGFQQGAVFSFSYDNDGLICDLRVIDENANMEYEVKRLKIGTTVAEGDPFLTGQHEIFGTIGIPYGPHTKPGTYVDVKVSYNDLISDEFSWYVTKVFDYRTKEYVNSLGCSTPMSILYDDVLDEELSIDVHNLNRTMDSSCLNQTSTDFDEELENSVDPDIYGQNMMDVNFLMRDFYFTEPILPQSDDIEFKLLEKYKRPDLETKTFKDKVIVLGRSSNFSIVLSYSAKEFGIMFPSHDSFHQTNVGNVCNANYFMVPEGCLYDFYSYIVEEVKKISTWKIESDFRANAGYGTLAVTIGLTKEDITKKDGNLYFAFGNLIGDDRFWDFCSKEESFSFKAKLFQFKPEEEGDERVIWNVDSTSICPK